MSDWRGPRGILRRNVRAGDKKKNILGETSVVISSYEKQGTVEPYYANSGDALFERLQDVVENQKVLMTARAQWWMYTCGRSLQTRLCSLRLDGM